MSAMAEDNKTRLEGKVTAEPTSRNYIRAFECQIICFQLITDRKKYFSKYILFALRTFSDAAIY